MSESVIRHALSTAGIMIAFSLIGTALLATTFFNTREPIAQSEAEARLELFRQILPPDSYDNALLTDTVVIPAGGALHNRAPTLAYRARMAGQPAGVILETVAPDGYSGDIKLLVAVKADGAIAGVRVLAHKETPGLGDYIDIAHDDWIKNFDGRSLDQPQEAGWKVKKDGGVFDNMAGATITPRAVVKAVQGVLKYFAENRESLFASADKSE
ncbi:MAG: electron transport complex subunit RsxG [Methylobacterium sp.]|nr:electron transport complex subunit RsxG [Methylobacterium sp.]